MSAGENPKTPSCRFCDDLYNEPNQRCPQCYRPGPGWVGENPKDPPMTAAQLLLNCRGLYGMVGMVDFVLTEEQALALITAFSAAQVAEKEAEHETARQAYILWQRCSDSKVRTLEETLREKGAEFEGFLGQVKALEEENARLRQFLWLSHGCTYTLYGDDGEMQCNETRVHRPLDFKRDSVEKLIEALRAKEASKGK